MTQIYRKILFQFARKKWNKSGTEPLFVNFSVKNWTDILPKSRKKSFCSSFVPVLKTKVEHEKADKIRVFEGLFHFSTFFLKKNIFFLRKIKKFFRIFWKTGTKAFFDKKEASACARLCKNFNLY